MSLLSVSGRRVFSAKTRWQSSRIQKIFGIACVLVTSLFAPLCVYAEPLRRDGLIPVTDESYFFVDNATLYEPYVSLDPKAPPLELSRLLNEFKRFPTMHFILEGDRRVIAMRIMAMGGPGKKFISTWSEDLTILLPASLPNEPSTKVYEASEIIGLFSAYGKKGMRTFWAFVASDGTVTVATTNKDSLKVSVDLTFKRIDVDYSLRLEKYQRDDAELMNSLKREASEYALIHVKKTFVAHRKAYQDLSFWEGRAGDVEISDRFKYCSRCFYDPETWDMFHQQSGEK